MCVRVLPHGDTLEIPCGLKDFSYSSIPRLVQVLRHRIWWDTETRHEYLVRYFQAFIGMRMNHDIYVYRGFLHTCDASFGGLS